VALRVTCHKSRLYHSDAVAERIASAIGDRLGQNPPLEPFDEQGADPLPQLIVVRLASDRCTISADSSGALLSKRGYRLAGARAPLRETLAAGMLMACSWEPARPLLDPFCGSGTIAIEAALLARGLPPGGARRFAFMHWPDYTSQAWERLLEEAHDQIHDLAGTLVILASDRDAGAIERARANAERAGVANCIQFSHRAVSAVEPSGRGWVITNPPYGRRLSADKDLRNLYAQLGNVLRAKCPGWQVGILCNDLRLLGQTQLQLDTSLSLNNGGLRVMLGRGVVP
jgi:putative N6-adenine-specific DNA methylase